MDKILIVDDSLLQSRMLEDILIDDYFVEITMDSADVVEKAEEFQPSLILLDVIMPVKSGFEVLSELKESSSISAIPVILITSLSDMGNEEKGLMLGAVDYITKPFNQAIVKARIQTHIQLYNYRREIERLAMMDALTELPNRRAYDERIREEWIQATVGQYPLSIALLDIDYFKQYNDTYGHPAGDTLLKKISSIFSIHLKKALDFAARYGGEEFIFLISHADSCRASLICDSIRNSVEKLELPNIRPSGEPCILTVSMGGITIVPQEYQNFEDYVKAADQMLYKAKNSGRNTVVWSHAADSLS